jgi:hypothetical protein
MNTRLLMRASSILMGALGVSAIFAPQEIIVYAGGPPSVVGNLVIEIAGALYFGFAVLNWMAQANLIGGIYSRPVAMGNFAHFFVAALALLKAVLAGERTMPAVVTAAAYTAFAVLFTFVLFGDALRSAVQKDEA